MKETKLKACPFCGESTAEIGDSEVPKLNNRGAKQAVFCPECCCEGPVADTESQAMDNWNARAGDREPESAQSEAAVADSLQRVVRSLRGQFVADCDTTLTTKGNRLALLMGAICLWTKEIKVMMSDTKIIIHEQTSNAAGELRLPGHDSSKGTK